MENIRNFCIIAHIDHGKSTLADRLLDLTGAVEKRKMKAQYLDQLDLERERGITIKMAPIRMEYKGYILNLIDTPGHSDFSYEVSRALAAVEGAILLVDGTQGIQAQTLANFHSARRAGLKIIGVLNKVDMDPPHLEEIAAKTAKLIGCPKEEILRVSAKTGLGVENVIQAVIEKIPPPQSEKNSTFSALIFDSVYDDHKGDIAHIRVFDGSLKSGDEVFLSAAKTFFKVKEVGFFHPEIRKSEKISAGEIGFVATGLKDPEKIKIGDTILGNKSGRPLSGYKEPTPVVFVSFYPSEESDYDELKQALSRLKMNDSSLTFEADRSEVLGRGFKCGFLGRLHFEIVFERLKREFGLSLVNSFPSVAYIIKKGGKETTIFNPKDFPDDFDEVYEPLVNLEIISPNIFLNGLMQLNRIFHMKETTTENFDEEHAIFKAKMPLADLIRDFDDKLKSVSEGYASFSYEFAGYEKGAVEKLEILVAGEVVSGLTRVVAKDEVDYEARKMAEKLKDLLPRQQFAQAIQGKAHGQIIARETIPALKKDVTGYLYGGDRTRKMKLWKKQQRGKKRLKAAGRVDIKPEIFKELLKK
ncbi:MAG: translation elongation factor 4 [Candidatus Paceibacterota bacterium]